ncbi:MAG: peptide chain release factor N(5)-glutamine methyltransferase [Acidobacteriota bacterium]|nr:peptide chain release factor N(5)-glutamine methyltransferase [Acidobacteriota bacterium]
MRLKPTLDSGIAQLTAAGTGSPRLNAEVLLMFTLACDRAYLYAHAERELSAEEHARYQAALEERARGKPAQYITGHQEFWGLDFLVSPAVLIPRPETEHVVETVLELVRTMELARRGGLERQLKIVDVGTGSGCIALALAKELPGAEIVAVDISAAALEIARANAARLQLDQRVRFFESNLLSALPDVGTVVGTGTGDSPVPTSFDFVVSNPPYVGSSAPEKVQREVRDFEPKVAVFAGESGLEVYRQLIPQARQRLEPGGWLVMEIGFSMEAAVRALLEGWQEVRVTHDLQGIPRVVAARFKLSS